MSAGELTGDIHQAWRSRGDCFAAQKALQIIGKVLGGLVTLLGVFMKTFETDCFQVARRFRLQLPRWPPVHLGPPATGCPSSSLP